MIQEILAGGTVAVAALYLGLKLFILPSLRAKRPDVPVSRLVRRPAGQHPSTSGPSTGGGCH